MEYQHQAVLLEKTIKYLNCHQEGIYLDGTVGRGGHTKALLDQINEKGLVIGIDRDLAAIKAVKSKFSEVNNLKLIHGNFIDIPKILDQINIKKVEGMIFDLGISSPQIDNPDRGFSYKKQGPLDMRMNRQQNFTAADIVNNYSKTQLKDIITEYGEERWASRIAQFIVKQRQQKSITSTHQLVDIIKMAIPAGARRKGGHPAKRTFQALRIETNNELKQLKTMIENVVSRLEVKGRICIISFHSLEDRIVKHTFRDLAKNCVCPPDFPICVCDKKAKVKVITKSPINPSAAEIERNPRSRSAKLRVAEKI